MKQEKKSSAGSEEGIDVCGESQRTEIAVVRNWRGFDLGNIGVRMVKHRVEIMNL